jgi:hypothetical protein
MRALLDDQIENLIQPTHSAVLTLDAAKLHCQRIPQTVLPRSIRKVICIYPAFAYCLGRTI